MHCWHDSMAWSYKVFLTLIYVQALLPYIWGALMCLVTMIGFTTPKLFICCKNLNTKIKGSHIWWGHNHVRLYVGGKHMFIIYKLNVSSKYNALLATKYKYVRMSLTFSPPFHFATMTMWIQSSLTSNKSTQTISFRPSGKVSLKCDQLSKEWTSNVYELTGTGLVTNFWRGLSFDCKRFMWIKNPMSKNPLSVDALEVRNYTSSQCM